jgi:L-ascorbate metabolism protein UlaG (beta-lactamase superfamily)
MVRRALLIAVLAVAAACAPTPPPHAGGYHGSDADVIVTRLGHAGLLISIEGKHFVVDPWLHESLFVHQGEPLGMRPSGFPEMSAVLLTGEDSLRVDETALTDLASTVSTAVAPPDLERPLRADGFREVMALRAWQDATIDGVRVTAVPARGNGYLLRNGDAVVYVAGEDADPGTAAEVRRIAGSIDVAVLPIGGRRTFGVHTSTGPEQAADAAARLGAHRIIPCAYGAAGVFPFVTFASDPVARFRQAATAAGVAPDAVIVLDSGESWHYYR